MQLCVLFIIHLITLPLPLPKAMLAESFGAYVNASLSGAVYSSVRFDNEVANFRFDVNAHLSFGSCHVIVRACMGVGQAWQCCIPWMCGLH